MKNGIFLVISAIILSIGLYKSFKIRSEANRVVVVKGFSEKEVSSNMAIWPIRFVINGNDMAKVYTKINADTIKVLNFLKAKGLGSDEVIISAPELKDRFANDYVNSNQIRFRYEGQRIVTIKSKNTQAVLKAEKFVGDLLREGVILNSDYETKIRYLYTDLESIKPEMIKESTISARNSAEQFAKDSKSSIGKIKSARQGFFTIEDADVTTPHIKKVRVVTSITYFLEE